MNYKIIVIIVALSILNFPGEALAEDTHLANTQKFVGVINPLSGVYHKYGEDCQFGYDLAYNELDSEKRSLIGMKVEDDQSIPRNAVNIFRKFNTDKNLISVGVFGSYVALAVNPLSITSKIPVIGLAGHADFVKNNPLAFSSWGNSTYEAYKLSEDIKHNKISRLAIITLENDYPLYVRDSLLKALSNSNVEVVFNETITDQNENRTLVTKALSKNPDAIFLNLLGPSFSYAAKIISELGFKGIKYSVNANAHSDQLTGAGIQATNGMIFFGPDFQREFFLKLAKERESNSYTFCCYLGMKLVLQEALPLALANNLTPQTLATKLINTKEIILPDENISVKDRQIILNFRRYQAQDAKISIE